MTSLFSTKCSECNRPLETDEVNGVLYVTPCHYCKKLAEEECYQKGYADGLEEGGAK